MARKKVVVITGASSGIGEQAARLFGKQGAALSLAARREDRLEKLSAELTQSEVDNFIFPIDLSNPGKAGKLIDAVMDKYGRIDVLVNNAGYGAQETYESTNLESIQSMFNVNVISPMELARKVVPIMKNQGGGSIVNVASVAGLMAHPLNVVYCAGKSAMIGFSKSLRLELLGTGIRVTAVCPAATKTEFFQVASKDIPFHSQILSSVAPVEKVAKAVVWASERNRPVVFPTFSARLITFFDRYFSPLVDLGSAKYRNIVLRQAKEGTQDAQKKD